MAIFRKVVGVILLVAALLNAQFGWVEASSLIEVVAGFLGFGLIVYGTGKPNRLLDGN